MLEEVTKDMPNVSVTSFEGLTIDFADAMDARIIAVSYTHLDVYKRQVSFCSFWF